MRQPSLFCGLFVVVLTISLISAADKDTEYKSPYSVKFTHPVKELIADLEKGERGDPRRESSVPFGEWNSRDVRERFGHWGPPARHYAAPEGVLDKPVSWKRERTIAVALRFVGYRYQHHHIPDWQPPSDWPRKEGQVGHPGKGVDCSNFTAFVYNQGFGIKPSSGIKQQAAEREFPGPGDGRRTSVKHIALPESYAELVKTLKTGDLLYVRNREKEIAHVVLWVGSIGQAPDDLPLIIDSHGDDVKDSNGVNIPNGIQLRPFRDKSWYHHSASHAIRVWEER
jgi:hypothetical protein